MATFILKVGFPIIGILCGEHYWIRVSAPQLYEASKVLPSLPKCFGFVIFANVICTAITLLILGMRVGKARNSMKDKAIKDGDKDAEARYSYPKLYAEGFSEDAKKFNCIQRGHQQALGIYFTFTRDRKYQH